MKSYSSYFVKTEETEAVRRVMGKLSKPLLVPGSPWLVVEYTKGASPPRDEVLWGKASLTLEKSKALGEVIFLFADTSPDSFVYEHALGGELLRKLVWFPMLDDSWTPGWLSVEGTPEEWESALFRPERLPALLESERDRLVEKGELARFPEREAELRLLWSERSIRAGATLPDCDGSVARLVEREFGLLHPPG
jgi:hypothetical protein